MIASNFLLVVSSNGLGYCWTFYYSTPIKLGLSMSIDGSWKITINSPMGSQEATLTLNTDGGSLSGSMAGSQGTQEFEGGSIDGNNLEWVVDMTQPMPMKLEISATVEGDDISGNVKLGAFGDASFAGARA
jgi:hypothetical protein